MARRPVTCVECGDKFFSAPSGPMPKYCGDSCRKKCKAPGCDHPHLAKGWCKQHYNANTPRHRATEKVNCVMCGTAFTRYYSGPARQAKYLPACSTVCKLRIKGWNEPLPDDHPARWFGQSMAVAYAHCTFCRILFAHDARWSRAYCSSHNANSRPRFVSTSCHDCGKPVMLDRQAFQSTAGYGHAYCGKACSKRASKRRRRARENNAAGEFRWVEVIGLWLALGKRCAYCGVRSDKQPDPDHVIPLSRGGDNTINNVLPACRNCNTDKRALTIAEWIADRHARGKAELPHPWRDMGWRRLEQAPGDHHLGAA